MQTAAGWAAAKEDESSAGPFAFDVSEMILATTWQAEGTGNSRSHRIWYLLKCLHGNSDKALSCNQYCRKNYN